MSHPDVDALVHLANTLDALSVVRRRCTYQSTRNTINAIAKEALDTKQADDIDKLAESFCKKFKDGPREAQDYLTKCIEGLKAHSNSATFD